MADANAFYEQADQGRLARARQFASSEQGLVLTSFAHVDSDHEDEVQPPPPSRVVA